MMNLLIICALKTIQVFGRRGGKDFVPKILSPPKGQRSKVKEIIVLIKARSFLDELNLEHLTS